MPFLPVPPRTAPGRIVFSLVLGVGLPAVLFGILLLRTHGYEPMGLCTPAEGGLLPIDMSRGGAIPYTCAVNWDYVAGSMLLPGLGFALLAWLLLRLLARRQAG
jgi:hypothetical protein